MLIDVVLTRCVVQVYCITLTCCVWCCVLLSRGLHDKELDVLAIEHRYRGLQKSREQWSG